VGTVLARQPRERAHGRGGSGGCTQPRAVPAFPARRRDDAGNHSPVRLVSILDNVMEEPIRGLINKKLEEVI